MNIPTTFVFIFMILFTTTFLIELSREKESPSYLLYREKALINLKYKNISIKYAPSEHPGRSGKYDVYVTYYKPNDIHVTVIFPKEEESPVKLKKAINFIRINSIDFP